MCFTDWWSSYPRKVGKIDAEKAYKSCIKMGYSADDLLTGAKAFSELCLREKTDKKFTPFPASFLRAGRWMDEDLKDYQPINPVTLAAAKDRSDRLMKRGAYDPMLVMK
jgi:hypothetical protein